MTAKLSSHQEDYLEAIAELVRTKGNARVKDIAAYMGVTSASVNGAVKSLAESGHLHYEPYELLQLTPEGARYAHRIIQRHQVLQRFLGEVLLLEENEARCTACKIEHLLTDAATGKISMLTEFLSSGGDGTTAWLKYVQIQDKEQQL